MVNGRTSWRGQVNSRGKLGAQRRGNRRVRPGRVVPLRVALGHRITCADLRQPGTPRLKPPDGLKRSIRPPRIPPAIRRHATRWDAIRTIQRLTHPGTERWPVPARNNLLLQVGGVLGPATRLDTHPDSAYVGIASPNMPLRPIPAIRLIRAAPKIIHAAQYPRQSPSTPAICIAPQLRIMPPMMPPRAPLPADSGAVCWAM